MKYFYTGAVIKQGTSQTDPSLSLGGHISSSPIPNDMLQNIFSEASYLSIQQNKRETKMIVLQNDSSQNATELSLNFDINNDTLAKYRIAFVLPDTNNCFESIQNSAALPFNATFDDIIKDTPVGLPNLAGGAYIGIWLIRQYDFTSNDLKSKDCSYYQDQLDNPTTLEIQDSLSLILDYTLV